MQEQSYTSSSNITTQENIPIKSVFVPEITFDFAAFYKSINNNFKQMWEAIEKNRLKIQCIGKNNLLNIKDGSSNQEQKTNTISMPEKERNVSQNKSQDGVSLNYSQDSFKMRESLKKIQETNSSKEIQTQNAQTKASGIFTQQNQSVQEQKMTQSKAFATFGQQNNKIQQQIKPQVSAIPSENPQILLIQQKMIEISQRLSNIQITSAREVTVTSKKFTQLQFQIEKGSQTIGKRQNQLKRLQLEVNKFQDQLSEYKMKKQAKIMKMSNKIGDSKNNQQFNNYILQKIQQIMRNQKNLVTRNEMQDQNYEIVTKIGKIERNLNQTITEQDMSNIVNIINTRINNINRMKIPIKKSSFIQKSTNQEQQNPQEPPPQHEDGIMIDIKVMELQKTVKRLQVQMQQEKQKRQNIIKKIQHNQKDINKKLLQLQQKDESKEIKLKQHQDFMSNMNKSYNQKISEMQNQIIETQLSLEKLNNQMKFYSFVDKSDSNINLNSNSPNTASAISLDQGKVNNLQNQVIGLKKKYNKLAMKLQSQKQDLQSLRQDLNRQIDSLKAILEKKCDWQSLKKGINYFEERTKQIYAAFENLTAQMENQKKDESTAAKKGWTCLCCDKDIKNFQGKMTQAKFASIFPPRYQSPRIGGYYKQKEAQKQYKQLFVSKNRKHSLSKNKQDLPAIQ